MEATTLWNGGPDSLGEELTLHGLEKFMRDRGVDEEQIKLQVRQIAVLDFEEAPWNLADSGRGQEAEEGREPSPVEADYASSAPVSPASRWRPDDESGGVERAGLCNGSGRFRDRGPVDYSAYAGERVQR